MSAVYFHSPEEEGVAVRGSERSMFSGLCHEMLMAAIGPIFDCEDRPCWTRGLFPKDHYLQSVKREHYERSLSTALSVDHGKLLLPEPVDGFILALNTALAVGSDAMKLAARIHGQCEIHGWMLGKHRAWVADIVKQGIVAGLYRKGAGWEDTVKFLRKTSRSPVVMSFSVCESFPNAHVAGWGDRQEEFDNLSDKERWRIAFSKLKKDNGLQLCPERWEWPKLHFSPKVNGFDLYRLSTEMAAKGGVNV